MLAKDLGVPEEAAIPVVMQQIFEALQSLHNAGLVHRDVKVAFTCKPSPQVNVLVLSP